MTVSACHGTMAQLTVEFDDKSPSTNGLIDPDDFTFVGPNSTAYTLSKGAAKPKVTGSTFTVHDTRLIGITNDDTVTASGSVTCS